MPQETLVKRVEKLEEEMTTLAQLPAQVADLASQVSQLRVEMRTGFSAIRDEIRAGDEQTKRELRDEIRAGDEETRKQARELHEDSLRQMHALHDDGLLQMRILHEDVIERIARLHEDPSRTANPGAKSSPRRRHRRKKR